MCRYFESPSVRFFLEPRSVNEVEGLGRGYHHPKPEYSITRPRRANAASSKASISQGSLKHRSLSAADENVA